MRYASIQPARFLSRPNRFIALVETAEGVERVHVKNTGRCRELLTPGAQVYLARGGSPNRKTAWDLVAVKKGALLINMDAQAPNAVFREWAEGGHFVPDAERIIPEVSFGASRLDFCLERPGGRHFVEVKGVTLEEGGSARFPDAPTQRGLRHIQELRRAVEEGFRATLFFVVQMEGMRSVAPNDDTHPAFGQALRAAARAGVEVTARGCRVTPESIVMGDPVPVDLGE